MPIYEYACPDCGHRFDAMQKFSDDPIKECPACQASNVKKLVSATSFILKGGGWYKDHYGLKSGGGEAAASDAPAAAPAAGAAATPAAPGATPATPASAAPAASPTPAPSSSGSSGAAS